MSLTERLLEDVKAAMRAGDPLRRDTLRHVRSVLNYEEIERRHPLSDEEVVAVLAREGKRRQEAADAYRQAGREDLAAKEEAEKAIVEEYLPPAASEGEIRRLAQRAADELDAGPAQMGAVMARVMPQLTGRADGKEVAAIVRQVLQERSKERSQ